MTSNRSRRSLAVSAFLSLALAACLENEEDIEIRADGSIRVTVSAEGHVHDLAGGYPVPLAAPWLPSADAMTQRWLAEVGPDTGSAIVQRRVGTVAWPKKADEKQARVRIAASAEFPSVEEWPASFAPPSETYRDSYLVRAASLRIEQKNGRSVYTFERRFRGVPHRRFAARELAESRLPRELREKFEARQAVSAEEWRSVGEVVKATYAEVAERFVRRACVGVFTDGDASIEPADLQRIVDVVRSSVHEAVDLGGVIELYEFSQRATEQELDEYEGSDPIEEIETSVRDIARSALRAGLESHDVSAGTRHGVLFALESAFTSFDHATDVSDEKFTVRVRMPGAIVGGNFDRLDDGTAEWTFEGRALQDRDEVLRVVSVVR